MHGSHDPSRRTFVAAMGFAAGAAGLGSGAAAKRKQPKPKPPLAFVQAFVGDVELRETSTPGEFEFRLTVNAEVFHPLLQFPFQLLCEIPAESSPADSRKRVLDVSARIASNVLTDDGIAVPPDRVSVSLL